MASSIDEINSIINGYDFAKDRERVFTYIEFVKMFGFENDSNTFINSYKDYVTKWAKIKKEEITLSDEDFVLSKLIEILKSITLDYSSYEEQDFIAHVDFSNKDHIKALSALYSRKIRQITEFYRKKRNESVLIVNRNSMKGSAKSIQEIIYEKIFDYLFSDRNIVPSYVNLKRDLLISVENYVDIYSEYFDIPREKKLSDKTRAEMLSANMNDVDYRVYLEIELVISEILFSGNVYLEEIPLIAQLGVDLSQNCVGNMATLRDTLIANTTVNQVPLTEQVALKRRLYEKFLGCDLYYLYVDLQGNIKMDILAKASNPTGNLLNCGTADTATIETEQLELLSHIGLFFKPDKTSILKVNAKSFVWSVDTDVIQPDTMYVFPDPSKYGDIGNNKSATYPLIMEYKLDYDIRNMSSGESVDDPLMLITDQGWRSYYSKQDDDFKLIDNKDYSYSFTYLANQGFLHKYQTDVWGNQFGILKGCNIETEEDKDGKLKLKKVTLPKHYVNTEITHNGSTIKETGGISLNGGYFEDPFYKGEVKRVETTKWKDKKTETGNFSLGLVYDSTEKRYRRPKAGETATLTIKEPRTDVPYSEVYGNPSSYVSYIDSTNGWAYNDDVNDTRPFDYIKNLIIDEQYNWSGLKTKMEELYYSNYINNSVNCGTFGSHKGLEYRDNFQYSGKRDEMISNKDEIITEVLLPFLTKNVFENPEYEIEADETAWDEYEDKGGDLYIKLCASTTPKPLKFEDVFDWVELDGKITNCHVINETIILETKSTIYFVPYNYDGTRISNTLGIRELLTLDKTPYMGSKVIYNEQERTFYIIQLKDLTVDTDDELNQLRDYDKSINTGFGRRFVLPIIYKFNPILYKIEDKIDVADIFYESDYIENNLGKTKGWYNYVKNKNQIQNNDNLCKLKHVLFGSTSTEHENLRDLEIMYYPEEPKLQNYDFTYNSSLGIYLLVFSICDKNSTPYIYEYKFKISDNFTFRDSLQTNIYTIKNEGTNYTWNDKLNATKASSIPNNTYPIGKNTIFRYYEQEDYGEEFEREGYEDKFFNGKKFQEKYIWEDDNQGGTEKCKFSTDLYISDTGDVFDLQKNVKTTLSVILSVDGYIKSGENRCAVIVQELKCEGKTNKNYSFLSSNNYKQSFQSSIFRNMIIYCDEFGNICGNHSIPFESDQVFTDRRITGEVRVCVYGTVDDIFSEINVTVWDITGSLENTVDDVLVSIMWNELGNNDRISELTGGFSVRGLPDSSEVSSLYIDYSDTRYHDVPLVPETGNNVEVLVKINDEGNVEENQYFDVRQSCYVDGKSWILEGQFYFTGSIDDLQVEKRWLDFREDDGSVQYVYNYTKQISDYNVNFGVSEYNLRKNISDYGITF